MKNIYELLFQEEERYGDGRMTIQKFRANSDSEALAIVLNNMSLGDFTLDFDNVTILESGEEAYDLSDLKDFLDTNNGDGGYVYYLKNISTRQTIYDGGIDIQDLGTLELPSKVMEDDDLDDDDIDDIDLD